MRKISITTLLVFIMVFSNQATAQYYMDALRFSNMGFGGTARSMAVGGAFGAAGADLSVLSTNPAGIGLYKSSEVVISPSLYINHTEASYFGQLSEDTRYAVNFPGMGVILNMTNTNSNSNWKNFQMGFGYNKLQDFNQRTEIEGFNHLSSLMTEYMFKAEADQGLNAFDTELAWDANLLWYDDSTGQYVVDAPEGGINQRKSIREMGAVNEMVLSFGGNYNDVFYTGLTVGFPLVSYSMRARHREEDIEDNFSELRYFDVNDEITTNGSGVNVKFGVIARPVAWLRLGGAIHSPTFFNLKEDYERSITSRFNDAELNRDNVNHKGTFSYRLVTPMRALGDIAVFIGKYGFISAQYEFVDYSRANLSDQTGISTQYIHDFKPDNDMIQESYTAAHNLKFGAEVNLAPFQIRGGYAVFGSPYEGDVNDGQRTFYTFGLGLREKSYFVDLAWVMEKYEEDYYLYSSQYAGMPAEMSHSSDRIVLTLGLKL